MTGDLPLWEVLQEACAENPDYPGVPDMAQSDWAIVFKVLADHLSPEEIKPPYSYWENPGDMSVAYAMWMQRQAFRNRLLREAEVANG